MFDSSSIPFWTGLGALASLAQVLVLIVTAVFVYHYLQETKKLRLAAQSQAEATFRPAIIATGGNSTESSPRLENIGYGPAMELEWALLDSDMKGTTPFLQPEKWVQLPFDGIKPLFNAGLKKGPEATTATIVCRYRSLSGVRYSSMCIYTFSRFEFVTTFGN